ncbi:MAG: glycosyltransferase family 2 protein [Chlamydiia bacterium]
MSRNFCIPILLGLLCGLVVSPADAARTQGEGQFPLRRKTLPRSLKTSIIIPCFHKHFECLPSLLAIYQQGPVLPDEVVIGLTASQRQFIPDTLYNEVVCGPWSFRITIAQDPNDLPGDARNAACQASSGELLICQDADDIPHPSRLLAIKHLFENYDIDFLIHRWIQQDSVFPEYSLREIENKCTYFRNYRSIEKAFDFLHNGDIALRRRVFDKVKWPGSVAVGPKGIGEDIQFNMKVLANRSFRAAALDAYLMIYRWQLSSYQYR